MRRKGPEPVATVRLDRRGGVAYVALADMEGKRTARSTLVRAPGSGTEALRVDLDAEGRLLGVEVLAPAEQLPGAVALAGPGDTSLEAERTAPEGGGVRVTLDPGAHVVARAPVSHAAGEKPPALALDGEGRLVAVEVPEPAAQLAPELLRRVAHVQPAPEAVFAGLDGVLWTAKAFEEPLARALDAEGWAAEALVAAPVAPERLAHLRQGGLPGGAIHDDAVVARLERELRADPWAVLVVVEPLGSPGDPFLARETVPYGVVGDTIVYATAARDRASIEDAWFAASAVPAHLALVTRHAPDGDAAAVVDAATLVLLNLYDNEGLLLLRRRRPAPLHALDALWAAHRVELRRDHVGLWELVGRVRRAHPEAGAEEVQARTLAVLRRGLADPGVVAGTFEPKTFRFLAWDGAPEAIVERARREWDALGHVPGIGEVLWLTTADLLAVPRTAPRPKA